MRVSIYSRVKTHRGWRFKRVKFGRGLKHADVSGPFYLRHTLEGRQVFSPAKGDNLADVVQEAQKLAEALTAESRGLTVKEYDEVTNAHRVTIQSACDEFIKLRQKKAPRTVAAYTLHLKEFQESLGRTRYMDDIDAGTLRKFLAFMTERGHSTTTQDNRLTTVFSLLKKNGIKERLGREELPDVEIEDAVPFEPEKLERLFNAMTDEERVRYRFFLGTGARDSEVAHASWADIDFHSMEFHVRAKPEVGFRLKGKESRSVPMPGSLVALLKERRKKAPHPRWVFVNEEGNPEKHFLRKFKLVAFKAGLNCGHCTSETTQMTKKQRAEEFSKVVDWENWDKQTKLTRTVTCADAPVCEHWFLHRLRKTCATRWHHAGVPVRTIQAWLGHKSLEVTQRYLGVADSRSPKVRQMVDAAACD